MGKQALTAFLIRLAIEPEFTKQWGAALETANAGGEDPRRAILDQEVGLEEHDKDVLLAGNATDIESEVVGSSQHTDSRAATVDSSQHTVASSQHTAALTFAQVPSSQHTVASSQHTVASSQHTVAAQNVTPQGPFKITITVEPR